jgi:hypothetical protein
MTFIDPENFRRASTFIHVCQGGALLVLGAAEAYAADNRVKKINFLPPAAFILGAALMLGSMLYFLGGWKLQPLRDALELKGGFYVFAAFAWFFAAAGLSRLMALHMGEKGGVWQFLFLAFLCVIGLLYFSVPCRVSEAARLPVFAAHAAMGITLLAAVLAKSLHFFSEKKTFQVIWAVLIFTTAGQLLIYREDPRAFEFRVVTIQSSPVPQIPAIKKPTVRTNAKPADKKRPSNRSRL